MGPIGLVKQFHKLSRTIEFDLFGFGNLEILNFEVRSSTDFTEKFKFKNNCSLDNVENYDRWGLRVSDTGKNPALWIMFKMLTGGASPSA